ncbi:uncharacterized protein N7506_002362 [Penicillium brevicompactum]|uniref:uncharacterized protein n=1 Tax=Penicillium brevicompactum TaxID=5074 RepID=UPI002540FE66|nr:uncharacterized protein N7506_002362 [Penicillium brevicompactum]KAJ5349109.1 hypothetical protein N7506_002362 [Penicillium brevicompactum]
MAAFEKTIGPVWSQPWNLPGVGYQSIHPFADSLHDGSGEDITVLGAHGKFFVKSEGNSVIAQLNLPTGGHEIKLLEWESHVAGDCSVYQVSCYIFDSLKPLTGQLLFGANQGTQTVFRFQDSDSMPNIEIESPQLVYSGGVPVVDVNITFTNLEKLTTGGLVKGSVKNRHISITLYNVETNAKIEGALGEGVKLIETDFDGSYGQGF